MSAAVTAIGGHDVMAVARLGDGEAVAVVSCHVYRGRALYMAGASTSVGLEARANPLCLHAAILECRALGVTTFELGRFDAREAADKESTITRYKSQFGGEIVRLTTFGTAPTAAQRASEQLHRARRKLRVLSGGEYFYP
jgi:hypothetical protein